MIIINMKLPDCCDDCPCSHWIQSGPFEGHLMCNVIQDNLNDYERSIMDEWDEQRPNECPIKGEVAEWKLVN